VTEPNDVAYIARSESCTLLLDSRGICRRVIPVAGAPDRVVAAANRCAGAQFVASLDASIDGLLGREPQVGASMLFALVDPIDGHVSLVRFGPVVAFQVADVPVTTIGTAPMGSLSSDEAVRVLAPPPPNDTMVELASEPAVDTSALTPVVPPVAPTRPLLVGPRDDGPPPHTTSDLEVATGAYRPSLAKADSAPDLFECIRDAEHRTLTEPPPPGAGETLSLLASLPPAGPFSRPMRPFDHPADLMTALDAADADHDEAHADPNARRSGFVIRRVRPASDDILLRAIAGIVTDAEQRMNDDGEATRRFQRASHGEAGGWVEATPPPVDLDDVTRRGTTQHLQALQIERARYAR
jgi:hypothetical protein